MSSPLVLLQSAPLTRIYHSTILDPRSSCLLMCAEPFLLANNSNHQQDLSWTSNVVYRKMPQMQVWCMGENFESSVWQYQSCWFWDVSCTDPTPLEWSNVSISSLPFLKTVAGGGQPAIWFVMHTTAVFVTTGDRQMGQWWQQFCQKGATPNILNHESVTQTMMSFCTWRNQFSLHWRKWLEMQSGYA